MVFCTSCGSEGKAGARFCMGCGTALLDLGAHTKLQKMSSASATNLGSHQRQTDPGGGRGQLRSSEGPQKNRSLQEAGRTYSVGAPSHGSSNPLRRSVGDARKFDGTRSEGDTVLSKNKSFGNGPKTGGSKAVSPRKEKKDTGIMKAIRSVTSNESDNPFLAQDHKHLNPAPKEDKRAQRSSLQMPKTPQPTSGTVRDDSWINRGGGGHEVVEQPEEEEGAAEKMKNLLSAVTIPSLPSLKFSIKSEEKDPVKERWKKEKKERKEKEKREREEKEKEEREKEKKEREKEKEKERKIREKEREKEREEREREKEIRKEEREREKERKEKEREEREIERERERERKDSIAREGKDDADSEAKGVKALAKFLPRGGKKDESEKDNVNVAPVKQQQPQHAQPPQQSQPPDPAELYSRTALTPVTKEETRRPPPQQEANPWGQVSLKKTQQPQPEPPQPQQPQQPGGMMRKGSLDPQMTTPPPSPRRRDVTAPVQHTPQQQPQQPPALVRKLSFDATTIPQRREAPLPPVQTTPPTQRRTPQQHDEEGTKNPSRDLISQLQQQMNGGATNKRPMGTSPQPQRGAPLKKSLSGDQIGSTPTANNDSSSDPSKKPSIMNRMKVKFTITPTLPQAGDVVDAFYPEDKQWYPAKIEMVKIPKLQKGKVRYHVVFAGYAKVEQKLSPEFIRLSGGRIELGRPSLKPGPLPPPGSLSKPPKATKLGGWKALFTSTKESSPNRPKTAVKSDAPMPGMHAARLYKPKTVKHVAAPPSHSKYQSHSIRASRNIVRNPHLLSLEDAFSRAYADMLPMYVAMAFEGEESNNNNTHNPHNNGHTMRPPAATMGPSFNNHHNSPFHPHGGRGPPLHSPGTVPVRRAGTKLLPSTPTRPTRPTQLGGANMNN